MLEGLRFELQCENEDGRSDENNDKNLNDDSTEHDSTHHVCVGLVSQAQVPDHRPWVKWCVWVVCLCAWFYFVGYTLFPYINNVSLAYLIYAAGVVAISKLVLKEVTSQAIGLGICGPLVVVGVVLGAGVIWSML